MAAVCHFGCVNALVNHEPCVEAAGLARQPAEAIGTNAFAWRMGVLPTSGGTRVEIPNCGSVALVYSEDKPREPAEVAATETANAAPPRGPAYAAAETAAAAAPPEPPAASSLRPTEHALRRQSDLQRAAAEWAPPTDLSLIPEATDAEVPS